MVYEFILGERLSEYYISPKYTARWHQSESITAFGDIAETLNKYLRKAFIEIANAPEEITIVLASLAKLKKDFDEEKEELNDNKQASYYAKLREILSLLSFYGYETYLLERPDIPDGSEQDLDSVRPNRAYLLDNYDNVFTMLSRVGTGYSVGFESPETMSVPDMIFSFLGRSVRFTNATTEALHLNELTEKYQKLLSVSSAWTMNVEDLTRFLKEYGFTLFGIVG